MSAWLRAALLLATSTVAQAEQAEPVEPPSCDLREGLHAKQLAYFDDPAPVKCAKAGRRAGKSVANTRIVTAGAIEVPEALNFYISITKAHAKQNFWGYLKTAALLSGHEHKVSESELTITFDGGGQVVLGGADNIAEIEKRRGSKVNKAVVDECQRYPSDALQYLVEEVLEPATMDVGGQIALSGTVGLTQRGYWYDLTGPAANGATPVHDWTVLDNPHIPHAGAWLEALRKRRGWTEQTPKYQREYLAIWVVDEDALAFPVAPHNFVDKLPTHTPHGVWLPPQLWRHGLAADIGYVDAVGLTVTAAHPLLRDQYVLFAEKHERMLVDQLAARILELRRFWPAAHLVFDTGGMGKQHAEELIRRYHLPIEAADKRDKASQVRITREGLQGGRVKLLTRLEWPAVRGEERRPDLMNPCQPLVEEWAVMGWKDDAKELPDPNAVDHASDSTLYNLRRLRHYTQQDAKPETPEREADRMRRAALRRAQKRRVAC